MTFFEIDPCCFVGQGVEYDGRGSSDSGEKATAHDDGLKDDMVVGSILWNVACRPKVEANREWPQWAEAGQDDFGNEY